LGAVDLSRVEIRNPLPASGGFAAEPLDDVKRLAPERFQTTLLRAVIPDDYAQITMARFPEVQRAAARERSTGSGSLIEVAVDFRAAVPADQVPTRLASIATALESFRRIGHAVRVQPAQSVPLDIALTVNLQPTTPRAPAIAQLRAVLGTRRLPDGSLGFFHPDNLTFGQGIASSQLIKLAQGVAGVQNVVVTRFQKLGAPPGPVLRFIEIGPLEVARLDQDPNRPENGVLSLDVRGGR
jgi:predicted phage baseplate assembly protein